MKIDPQEYLDLVEKSKQLLFFDIESTGLKGDYNSVICVSFKPYNSTPFTISIKQVGNDQKVVREASEILQSFPIWVTYYGSGFDIPMLDTRLLKWGYPSIPKTFHIDLYYKLKAHLLTGRKSQAHLLEWLGTPEQKQSVGASVWSEVGFKLKEHLPTMINRCESDVKGLEALYKRTRHLIKDIKIAS